MHFIEALFGVSPDGGTGATEAVYVGALIAGGLLLAWARRRRRQDSDKTSGRLQ
jgi:MYXO-CTERM domain-containing protein